MIRWCAILVLGLAPTLAQPHGGVVEEEDLCVIKVNYLRGHFKIYQPLTSGHREYCEDLPDATESVFVMEYLHDSLSEAAVDFRIIRDVTGKGRFARWDDIQAIDDLDAATVFYQPPTVDPDVLTVIHDFDEEGDFIGVVTANVGGDGQVYRAVFPFEVGYTGLGFWPYILLLLLLVELLWLYMTGRLQRWWSGAALILVSLTFGGADAYANEWTSQRGIFTVHYESSLDPIEINRMHSWTLVVTRDNEPLEGADITVSGGMPEHDHGMPTRPRVTADLGGGRYRLDGMRFHMNGTWEVMLDITAGGSRDTVIITLVL
ncbi:MAG: FixH family protein [Woeseiaceae bacterium]|nr:FixH family protein [Woeseiaceae bacterium]